MTWARYSPAAAGRELPTNLLTPHKMRQSRLSFCLAQVSETHKTKSPAHTNTKQINDGKQHPRHESPHGRTSYFTTSVRLHTSRVRFTQTYKDGRGTQEVSIASSLDSNRLRIGRNGPIIALWAGVQPAKSLILGTSGLIDPPGPRLRPPDLYIIRKLSERRSKLCLIILILIM